MEEMKPEEQQEPSQSPDETVDQPQAQPADVVTPAEAEQPTQPAEEVISPDAALEDTQPIKVVAPAELEEKHLSKDEALAEMRRSLREEETLEKTGFAASMGRLGKRFFGGKQKPAEEVEQTASPLDELLLTEAPETSALEDERLQAAGPHGTETEIEAPAPESTEDAFQTLIKKRLTSPLAGPEQHIEPSVAPEPTPLETIGEPEPAELAKPLELEPESEHAIAGRSILTGMRQEEEGGQDELSALRQEALEDYVTEPETPEDEGHTSLTGRLRRSWRYMRPFERNLIIGTLVIVGLAVLGGGGLAAWDAFAPPPATPAPTPTFSPVPFPISISLPGGWIFPLKIGTVDADGVWRPKGAEWLQGTEVCRIVSLPWTVQLEAVIRTLNANDEIKLSMSNYDSPLYKVQSIDQKPANQVAELAKNTPCLLVILSKADTETRWVVTAKP